MLEIGVNREMRNKQGETALGKFKFCYDLWLSKKICERKVRESAKWFFCIEWKMFIYQIFSLIYCLYSFLYLFLGKDFLPFFNFLIGLENFIFKCHYGVDLILSPIKPMEIKLELQKNIFEFNWWFFIRKSFKNLKII